MISVPLEELTYEQRKRLSARSLRRPVDLRMVKIVGVVLPILFIVLIEVLRLVVVEHDPEELAGHLSLALTTVLAVVAFALVMFHFIGRAQAFVLFQNRELAAVTAVSTAVRAHLGVDELIGTALDRLVEASGAREVTLVVGAQGAQVAPEGSGACKQYQRGLPSPIPTEDDGLLSPLTTEIPLVTLTSQVGTLTLVWPGDTLAADRLGADALHTIGHQLAYAIQHAQLVSDLQRGKLEGHAFYDILLLISNAQPLASTLTSMLHRSRERLTADEVVLQLDPSCVPWLELDGEQPWALIAPDGMVRLTTAGVSSLESARSGRPWRAKETFDASMSVPVGGREGRLGELWIGRKRPAPFTERDRAFLATVAELVTIAVTNAGMRARERDAAVLAERERIARELHDSIAQVLGVTQLRLHALRAKPEVRSLVKVEAELHELAGICQEAYGDVREAILGLAGTSKAERTMLDALGGYLEKYTRQSGVEARMEIDLTGDLVLPPGCEVQVIRVIQEALTNVRKHSGARSAVVRVGPTRTGTRFVVEDDGHGFDPQQMPTGRDSFGLRSMQERMTLIHGGLTIDSAPGRGTRVVVDLPVHRAIHRVAAV